MKAKMMMNKTEKVFESLLSMTCFQSQVSSSKIGARMYSVCECGSAHAMAFTYRSEDSFRESVPSSSLV